MRSSILLATLLLTNTSLHSQTIDERIHIDQFGYRPNDKKIAVISSAQLGYNAPSAFSPGAVYDVIRNNDNKSVFSGSLSQWRTGSTHPQSGDKVWWFDFSAVNVPGDYYIKDATNNIRSFAFRIAPDIYNEVLKHAVRVFFYQRSGFAKVPPFADSRWTDGASHLGAEQDLDCRLVTNPTSGTSKNLSGGWFDAGDFNKYVNFTHSVIHDLLSAYEQTPTVFSDSWNIPESNDGAPDLLNELKWELDWLLKMQVSDGSVLTKVSVTGFTSASPASADVSPRRYGAASSSSTRTFASVMAHAAIVYKSLGIPAATAYGDQLLLAAQNAWNWLQANPGYSNYSNQGFSSANPEISNYQQDCVSLCAAIYLYAATSDSKYVNFIKQNYTKPIAIANGYWFPFEASYQDALLYLAKVGTLPPHTTFATTSQQILQSFKASLTNNNPDLLGSFLANEDAYRAYLKDQDYVWGSNRVKSDVGSIYANAILYNADPANNTNYAVAAEDYLHYLHGVNPNALVYLTNMNTYGAEKSANEMYHAWFGDGTIYDNAQTSPNGPPPGYVTGGANPTFQPDGSYSGPPLNPPMGQPAQKSYKDWNTSYPQNSWSITEPAIYYQASYVKLLSKFATAPSTPTGLPFTAGAQICIYPNPAKEYLTVEMETKQATEIGLYNLQGQLLTKHFLQEQKAKIETAVFPTGVYILKIKTEDGVYSEKVILDKQQ